MGFLSFESASWDGSVSVKEREREREKERDLSIFVRTLMSQDQGKSFYMFRILIDSLTRLLFL
jgi:hypothetical protein